MTVVQINLFLHKMEAGENRVGNGKEREREKQIIGVRDRA